MKLGYSKTTSDALKIVGVSSMIIDHIGYVFFPQVAWLRIIGRLAFPIFAAGIVNGYRHTSDWKKYAMRLLIFGLLAQIPFQLILGEFRLNILFSFFFGLLIMYFFETKKYFLIVLLVFLSFKVPIEHEWFGLATIFIFFLLKDKFHILLAYLTLIFVYVVAKNEHAYLIYFYSIFGALLVLFPEVLKNLKSPALPKYFFYFFYPAHLIILLVVKYIVY